MQRHHEICTSQRCFIFYIWWLAKKQSYLCQKIVIYSCGGVLVSSILSLASPTITGKEKCWFYLTAILREKFHSSLQPSQQFVTSEADLVLASTFSEQHQSLSALIHNQQCSKSGRAHPKRFFQGSHPMGGHGDFAPLEFNRGFVHKAEFVTRKSGINYSVCITENNFIYLNNFMLLII